MPEAPAAKLECRFYRTAGGAEPTRTWLRGLAVAVRGQIGADLFHAQAHWPAGMPLVRALGDGLHELRSTWDGCEYRLVFCVVGKTLVVLHGFQKKSQKTPTSELETARRRAKEVEQG